MPRGGYAICWMMAALVALAPLPFGGVGPLWSPLLVSAVAATGLCWLALRWRDGVSPLPWSDPVLLAGLALLACGLLQIVPLPIEVVRILSPHAAQLKETLSPEVPAFTALSLNPYATGRACIRVICWTLAAVMVRHCAVDLKGRLIVAGGLFAGGLFQAAYGLFEFISGRQHIFGYTKKHFTDVATGTFISRNNFAGYLEMTIPIALALGLLCLELRSSPAERGDRRSPRRLLAQADGAAIFRVLLFLMAAFVMTTGLLMSRSRMGIISITVALVAGGVAMGLEGRSRRFAMASLVTVGVAMVFASQIDIGPVLNRFVALRNEFGEGYGRLKVWNDAVPLLTSYPLVGSGMGTFEMAFSPFRTDRAQVRVDFAHNDYLEFVSEAGSLGALVIVAGVLFAWRQRRHWQVSGGRQDEIAMAAGVGLLSLVLHSATDFHLSIPADALAAAVLLGLFLRPAGPARQARPVAGMGAPVRLIPGMVSGLALGVLVLVAVSPAVAEMRSPGSLGAEDEPKEEAERQAIPARTVDEALCPACSLDPANPAPYLEAAERVRRRLLTDVDAVMRSSSDGELPDAGARRYLSARLAEGVALADAGLAMSPASAKGHMEKGLLLMGRYALTGLPPQASDDLAKALESFDHAMTLQPWRAATHRRVARVTAPLWTECDGTQRVVIARAVRRARETSPGTRDIVEMAGRMGI